MKCLYDENAKERKFMPGDRVLALLPIPGKPLQARYYGPYTVDKKISDVNYIVNTPGRHTKKKQLCHVNMLKQYIDRDSSSVTPISVVSSVPQEQTEMNSEDMNLIKSDPVSTKLQNSDILKDPNQKFSHLDPVHRKEMKQLIHKYEHLFPDIPTRTDKIYHDVNVEDSQPVKQHPYRMNPTKQKYLTEEIQYLLDNDFIEPSQSEWSSHCILIPNSDGSYWMCTDYRKVNNLSKTDTFPIPRIDDCIDKIGNSKYITKFNFLKGFWQIPLTERAKEISLTLTLTLILMDYITIK